MRSDRNSTPLSWGPRTIVHVGRAEVDPSLVIRRAISTVPSGWDACPTTAAGNGPLFEARSLAARASTMSAPATEPRIRPCTWVAVGPAMPLGLHVSHSPMSGERVGFPHR